MSVDPLRSTVMSRIRSRDTNPELRVRRALHSMGYRFRLYRKDLPGTPDIVLPRHRTAIFVHGCFWHQHQGCRRASDPKTRREYWGPKLARNVERDGDHTVALKALGWRVIVIWECETSPADELRARLVEAFSYATELAES